MDKDKAIRAAKLTLGGMLEKRRAKSAVERAQGQIAPSKYLPGVPRQVHADGGSVDDARARFTAGNHPDVPDTVYHGAAPKEAYDVKYLGTGMGFQRDLDEEQTQRNRDAMDFRTFRPSEYGNYGPGIYLSDSPKVASDYAQGIRADQTEAKPHGQVMKLHVSMKQPFTDDALRHPGWIDYIKREIKQGLWLGGISAEDRKNAADLVAKLDNGTARVRDLFLTDTPEGTMVNQFGQHNIHKTIRNSGFDGIIAHRPDGTKEYVAFKPDQVKSAIGNQGTFDPTNPDMTKAEGGRIHANKGGKMGARADFVSGNHPEVPPVVYHSTKSDFHDFRPMSHFGTMQAAHDRYSPDQNLSQGMSVIPAHISMKNPLDVGRERDWQSNRDTIRQAADVMFKSGRLDQDYLKAAEKLYDLVDDPRWGSYHQAMERRGADLLREAGHDGIIYTNNIEDPGSRSFVTLGPEQVKSSIGNQGTFDPTHPDMTKKDGGEVDGDEGIDAYHGSPHDFDEFNIAHLGTGEGAQAYGHGLYFAGNESIAKHYRNALSDRNAPLGGFKMKSGQDVDILHAPDGLYSLMNGRYVDTDHDKLLSAAQEKLQWAQSRKGPMRDVLSKKAQDVIDFLQTNEGMRFERNPARGTMYKVKLNVRPHELLDWDAPLSEQPEVARKLGYADPEEIKRQKDFHYSKFKPSSGTSFEDLFGPLAPEENEAAEALSKMPQDWGNMTGKSLHDRLVAHTGSKKGAADAMQAAGLKGIKYRDAGSRDLSDGDPTHNYVMFHHDPVKVVDKYEYGGVVGKSGGGSMGDDGKPVDLGAARAMRNFNQNSTGPTPEAEGVFNRLAAARDAAADAHEAAIKDGVFNSAQIGDVFKYKPLDTYAPMKVVDHGMVPVERWGGINPPKYVYKDHFPVAEVQYQDASKERRKFPIELLEDRDRYDFLSGKPRIARADGGRLNLYSKAARIIAGMKDQPMQAADIVKYALGKGAKKTELDHMDVPPGKATPKQVADHIEFMQPHIGVHRREGGDFRFNNSNDYLREMDRLHDNGMHDEAERLYEEFERFEGHGPADKPIYARFQLPGGQNYREHILTLDSHEGPTFMARDHWGKLKNPLAHIRMSDRIINGKKILHIEELQSDWNNHARKRGFSDGSEKRALDEFVQDMRQKAIAGIDPTASPMIRQALQQKYGAMDPHTLAQKLGGDHFDRLTDLKYKTMPEKMGAPRAPYINPDRDDPSEVAMKHILMEAAKGGYDGIAFTPDEEQEKRWPGNTFKGIYNKKLPGMAKTLVQQHDPETDPDDMTHLQGWAVPMIPLSDKARDSIMQNGFSSFKRGGAVGYGDGGSVEPDIKNPMSIFPKPQRMFPEDQRPAGGQYLSMPNKADVTGHKAETATIGVAPGGKPFFRASQNAVDQTGSPGRGSATTKTNLFKQKAGWKWQEAPEGHENTDTIVSVEHRGRHFYALNAHFPKGVDLARYENATSEPRLRPTTQGNVELGPQAGSISVRGKSHPVYHHVIVKADGGAVDAALAATRRFTKDGQHVTMRLKD